MKHPDWCAQGHRCGLGEHRREPVTWVTEYGVLVATRVLVGRDQRIELRAVVNLDAAEAVARRQAQQLLIATDLTLRAGVAGLLDGDLVDALADDVPQLQRGA